MKKLVVAAAFAAFSLSPASAKPIACTRENLAKITGQIVYMPETPKKQAIISEIARANADLSTGNMRGACTHYLIAQRIQNEARDPFEHVHLE